MAAKHILVVEDEEVIRETLRFNLAREGYQVSQAANGIEALEKARELRPDLSSRREADSLYCQAKFPAR